VSPLGRVGGVVLAGGRSRRFGTDKLVAPYGDVPLLHRPIAALSGLCEEILVIQAADAQDLPLPPEPVVVRIVRDATLDQGPLAGTVSGLSHTEAPAALVVAGDMPELSVPVLRTMVRTLNEPGVDAVWLDDGNRPRPFPLALRVAPALAAAQRLLEEGERRMRALPAALGARVLPLEIWSALDPRRRTLHDVDLPRDLPLE